MKTTPSALRAATPPSKGELCIRINFEYVVDFCPLLRGGDDAPFKKMERYLRNGAARGGQTLPKPHKPLTSPAAPIT